MKQPPEAVIGAVPGAALLKQHVLAAPADAWTPAYGMVGGTLPLAELGPAGTVVFLQGEVEVVQAGKAVVSVTPGQGIAWWIDEQFIPGSSVTTSLARGRHTITCRVATSSEGMLTVEIKRPAGNSTIEFDVVSGSE
jgi:hypothetical protein